MALSVALGARWREIETTPDGGGSFPEPGDGAWLVLLSANKAPAAKMRNRVLEKYRLLECCI